MNWKKGLFIIGSILWIVVISIGTRILSHYENTPGLTIPSIQHWPVDAQIPRLPGQATLVLTAHPQCPCTRASIEELSVLMAHVQGRLAAYVLFLKPREFPLGWEKTDLWEHAAAIPGVQVIADNEGVEARRFHATVSGQTLLYDERGELVFSGGITGSRGYVGDNVGRSALLSLLTTGAAEHDKTFVFGCALFDDSSEQLQRK